MLERGDGGPDLRELRGVIGAGTFEECLALGGGALEGAAGDILGSLVHAETIPIGESLIGMGGPAPEGRSMPAG